ncbi:hypothetical protein PYCCODRAFT_1433261 [Trametes coccinea BRFM310]|uniref:S-adenosyl-L-methionine-dependent methyltransferase n=1 Tax=Trametes coccinea (strain BRFM310) TaxID=1353009 RepID=A0A1Y2IUZ8_TRAC3|nr:hypothetical protein PYCCODRAFT_1433261 [Trametes coccinea BRFM310]
MTILSPPSARLPPIRRIHEHSVDVLESILKYLRTIYNPPVRGTRRVDRNAAGKSSTSGGAEEDALVLLRTDEFERAYTIRWLTGLVAQASLIQDEDAEDDRADEVFDAKIDTLIRDAASLLAVCAGTAAASTVTRRFSFAAPILKSPVEVQLTDIPISVDGNAATVGAHTWGSACLLAEMVVESPERFGLTEDLMSQGLRVLELGAGTGLVSLATAKFLSARIDTAQPTPTVIPTDYHPEVLDNLAYNIKENFPDGEAHRVSLSAHPLDWSLFSEGAREASTSAAPFDVRFDVIFGADIIYEPTHARWIRDTVAALLRQPASYGGKMESTSPRFHLLIPLRPTHVSESRTVEEVFPRVSAAFPPDSRNSLELCILDVESILCEAEDRRPGAEVEYVHYTIGWA